ncbi:Tricorn protease domain-containing protein [Photobacterium sp. 53610]|uniref:Tricorn protease domain-containing protein n=1 Tax=Photobacterium sp. 53610 TaxID=3102789 RepID=UPI002ED9E025
MKKSMKSALKLSLLSTLLLVGCGQNEASVESNQPKEDLSIVEQKNAQEWEDGRIYITEHNYISYQNNNGKPKYYVYKAKEWPREDLSNESSYDLPRVVFRWDNGGRDSSPKDDYYERKDKVWSIKTDGTDLRLVADEFDGQIRLMRISPNNRYLALAYTNEQGMFKVIKDLKTGEYIELGKSRGYPEFLWAEDSSYLYFTDQWKDWKYTLSSNKVEKTDAVYNENSVIYNGRRYVTSELGVGVYKEETGEKLYSIVPDDKSEINIRKFLKKSISPTGRYVWAQTSERRYLIDTYKKSFQSEVIDKSVPGNLEMLHILGYEAKYARSGGGAQIFQFKMDDDKKIGSEDKWLQIGSGHSATDASIYNSFANDGNFFRIEVKNGK